MACVYKKHPVDLERLLRLSGTPTKKTIATAHQLLAKYSQILTPATSAAGPQTGVLTVAVPRTTVGPRPAAHPDYQVRSPPPNRPQSATPTKTLEGKPTATATVAAPKLALAIPDSDDLQQLKNLFKHPQTPGETSKTTPRLKQQNTNAWARNRISELGRTLGLPERVKARALVFYERIVDLHTARGGAPPGKRLQLSPRLNWSLVYTTLYLGCRFEEYPKDLRDILGGNQRQGSLREMYGLYRFYKRELKLSINLVDVKTFILSWFDGFEMSELIHEKAAAKENERIKNRAISIANRARGDSSLKRTSTKIIAAGALTTALAERDPPKNRHAFYMAMAAFLHMSEATIRFIVTRIAELS